MLWYVLVVVLLCLLVWSLRGPGTGIPALPGKLPLIGHALMIIGDGIHIMRVVKWIGEETIKLGGVASVHLGPKIVYAVADPDDYAKILMTCFGKPFFYDYVTVISKESLICSKLPLWKQQRKALNPAFSLQSLYNFMDIFNNQGRRLIWQLGAHGPKPFNHFHTILLNNLETSLQTVTGYDIDELEDITELYMKSVEQILDINNQRLCRVWLYNDYLYSFTSLKKEEDRCIGNIQNISQQAIKKKKLMRTPNNTTFDLKSQTGKRISFLDYILDQESKQFESETEIQEQLDLLIIAAYDTTATALVYIMTVVGSYPEVQQKICEEISAVLSNRDVTKDDLPKLVYLEAVVKETMRLYTVAPVVGRETDIDIKLKNYTIPKGSIVGLVMTSVHHHPVWGPDADQFRPERWLELTSLPENLHAFGAFSLGKRNCIGKTYAMMSMKIALVHVLRHYEITGDISKTKHKIDIMMKPVSGHHIILEERDSFNFTASVF